MKRTRSTPPVPFLVRSSLALAALLPLAACEGLGTASPDPQALAAAAERGIDVEHYALDLTLLPDVRRIEGSCRIHLRSSGAALDRVRLDFDGLDAHGVFDDAGRPLPFTHAGGVLTVSLDPPLGADETEVIEVRYGGSPKKGLWFSGDRSGKPTHVFTQGECEDSRWWFPCHDVPSDRATSEIRVTMPGSWTSLAAGELIGRTEQGGAVTEHWRMGTAHPAYLLTLAAGDFVTKQDEWNGLPLSYVAPQGYGDYLEPAYGMTPDVLGFLSEVTGLPYPYPKYSQVSVENFPFGGMENISATTMTIEILNDERGRRDYDSTGLVTHEAAHQWFGDLFTCKDWSHIWLNEGFATYMTELYFERTRGVDEFRVRMRKNQDDYVAGDEKERRPIVYGVYKDPIDLFGEHVYPGGASRLHLLRFVLGEQAFFAGVRDYVHSNVGRSVVTDDLRRALEKASGKDLSGFFEQWLLSPGFPDFVVSWRWDERRQVIELEVEQRQSTVGGVPLAFRTPVDVEVKDRRGSTVHRLQIEKRFHRFVLAAPQRPTWVRFDKNGWIPKKLEEKKQPDEWLALLSGDDDPNGRRDAADALGKLSASGVDHERRELFVAGIVDRLRKDPLPAVRVSAAQALGLAGGLEARARLMAAARQDSEAKVRVAALEALAKWGPDRDLARLADECFEDGYSWKVMGAAAGLFCKASPDAAYEWISKKMLVDSMHGRLRQNLIPHLASIPRTEVVDDLIRWARDRAAGSDARQEAVKILAKHPEGRSRASRVLAELLSTEDFHLRGAVVEALAERDDSVSRNALATYYQTSVFPSEKRLMEAALKKR